MGGAIYEHQKETYPHINAYLNYHFQPIFRLNVRTATFQRPLTCSFKPRTRVATLKK